MLNEIVTPYRRLREHLRSLVFRCFGKIACHDEGKRLIAKSLSGVAPSSSIRSHLFAASQPYLELPTAQESAAAQSAEVIFITARFRTGSTLLWNIFRHLPQVTAYYEPLNERRWFDPNCRGQRVDPTHRHTSEYWREYEGLECLGNYYRLDWIDQQLYMDEWTWDPNLKRYIEILIERSPARPVLQFNRVDFRLPWLRRNFPKARLVHLYRHPRDQWCSTLMNIECFGSDEPMSAFGAHDNFYLLNWARDLKYVFPFVDPASVAHPYELFYYLWKLSYIFGVTYAHVSIAFEDLIANPVQVLERMLDTLDFGDVDLRAALAIIEPLAVGKWREYASDEWFRRIELRCEQTIHDFIATARVEPSDDCSEHGFFGDPPVVNSCR